MRKSPGLHAQRLQVGSAWRALVDAALSVREGSCGYMQTVVEGGAAVGILQLGDNGNGALIRGNGSTGRMAQVYS